MIRLLGRRVTSQWTIDPEAEPNAPQYVSRAGAAAIPEGASFRRVGGRGQEWRQQRVGVVEAEHERGHRGERPDGAPAGRRRGRRIGARVRKWSLTDATPTRACGASALR
jgi:hypothetical protein